MSEKITVWFNHWFSAAYHIIDLLRNAEGDKLHIIGSNRNPDSVMKLVCDEWHTEESVMSDEDYLTFCLDFCREHNVRVFAPRRGMSVICGNAERFAEIGVLLLLDTRSEAVDIFGNKAKTYEYLSDCVPECIPMHFEVRSMDEFMNAYERITEKYERACFKFVVDEGAMSFRVIDNSMSDLSGLYKAPGMKISIDTAGKILNSYDFNKALLVMPYLKGSEASCDCLDTENGKIIIPRYKTNSRLYSIKYDEKLMRLCDKIIDKSKLGMPCNIQFKYDNDEPYLLEVNTRMSGGVQLSCLSAGVNIPDIAFNKLFGNAVKWKLRPVPFSVSYIEEPVIIK